MFDNLIRQVARDTVMKELPRVVADILPGVLQEIMPKADGALMPRTRFMFVRQIDAEMRAHWGLTGDPNMDRARDLMADIERESAPWGDADYSWRVEDARAWVAELMEDR